MDRRSEDGEPETQPHHDLLNAMPPSKPLHHQSTETDADRFRKSLRELGDLRSQLHHAADYLETAFLKTGQKKIVLANTKNYVREAMVTVVDHLGTVSANLEDRIQGNIELSLTEQRIDCLKQRLLTCQHYALNLDLSTLQLSVKYPRRCPHYVAPFSEQLEKYNGIDRLALTDWNAFGTTLHKKEEEPVPVDLPMPNTYVNLKSPDIYFISGIELNAAVPVYNVPLMFSKPCNLQGGSQTKDSCKLGGSDQRKKPSQGSNFLSFLGISKRTGRS